jgi:CAF1 family ribonuclease
MRLSFVDLVQTYAQFVGPLPENFFSFCGRLHALFPQLYDTKYLSNHHPDLEVLCCCTEQACVS